MQVFKVGYGIDPSKPSLCNNNSVISLFNTKKKSSFNLLKPFSISLLPFQLDYCCRLLGSMSLLRSSSFSL
eukprot:447483-Prorocentrum_lima.AAC.1